MDSKAMSAYFELTRENQQRSLQQPEIRPTSIGSDESLARKIDNYLTGKSEENITVDEVLNCFLRANGNTLSTCAGVEIKYIEKSLFDDVKVIRYEIERLSNTKAIKDGKETYVSKKMMVEIGEEKPKIEVSNGFFDYYNTSKERIMNVNIILKKSLMKLKEYNTEYVDPEGFLWDDKKTYLRESGKIK